jgi:hypothetical protein
MGCFGDMEPTKQKQTTSTSTVSPPSWVQSAGQQNYERASSILDRGYVPYGGTRVAPLSGDEVTAGNLVRSTAAAGNPYQDEAASLLRGYGQAPKFNYDFNTIVDESGPLGSIQSYMNPYLDAVLAPILRQIGISGAQQRNSIGSSATMSGAFGDARQGVVESEQRKNQMLQEGDAVGKGYSDAFNQALGLRSQDAGRFFQTQQAQEGADRAALERARASGIDLTNLDKYDVSRALGLSSALGGVGQNEREIAQKAADVDYDTFRQQNGGFDKEMISWLTQLLAGTPTAKTTTGEQMATESAPNNSGWQMVGTLASALLL